MTEFTEDGYFEDVGEWLLHYGVKGMRWGVRRQAVSRAKRGVRKATRSAGKFADKVKKIQDKAGKKKLKQQELKTRQLEAKAVLAKKKKHPKDMSDSELKDHHTKVTNERKLASLTKDPNLDRFSREQAAKTLRKKEGMSSEDLKKEVTRLETRSRQLKELRPSNSAKAPIGYKIAKIALKNMVNTDKVIETGLNKTVFKGQTDAIKKATEVANAVKTANDAAKAAAGTANPKQQAVPKIPEKRKASFMETSLKGVVKEQKNAQIDKAIDKLWKHRIDKRAGF